MSNLNTEIRKSADEYNNEPVYYCKHCLSLRIMGVAGMDDAEYCDECGSTNIGQTNIENWENLYREKYGMKFLENNY